MLWKLGPVAAIKVPRIPCTAMTRGLSTRREVFIVAASRTPIGRFRGSLSSLTGPELGAMSIKKALKDAKLIDSAIEEAYVGTVVQAGQGQAPGRQAVLAAGLPVSVCVTTINKACASSMKAVSLAAMAIEVGDRDLMLGAGHESMSQAPHLLPHMRNGIAYGPGSVVDALAYDGLRDPYSGLMMGQCAEKFCKEYGITREEQDAFATQSYRKALQAQKDHVLDCEIAPVSVRDKRSGKSIVVSMDEEPHKVDFDKMAALRPAFDPNGTITAANASKLNDGGVAIILASKEAVEGHSLLPMARVVASADAETVPIDFSIAPIYATEKLLKKANVNLQEIAMWEVNEAFSSVAIGHQRHFGYSMDLLNMHGGAVAMGHPIGMSGGRLVAHMAHFLKGKPGALGCASICNAGGGASAILLQGM